MLIHHRIVDAVWQCCALRCALYDDFRVCAKRLYLLCCVLYRGVLRGGVLPRAGYCSTVGSTVVSLPNHRARARIRACL